MTDDRPLRIAIVDDEVDVVTYLETALEDRGFEVHASSDPDGALEFLAEVRPDVVCLDLLMPGRSGVALFEAIRRHPALKDVLVVVITGLATDEDLRQALGGGSRVEFVDKPVDLDRLVAALAGSAAATGGGER